MTNFCSPIIHCLTHQDASIGPDMALIRDDLTHAQCQDLAEIVPYLACGEASAVHAFSGRLLLGVPADAQATLSAIAQDEMAHARLMDALQKSLPPAQQPPQAARLAMFFRRLESHDPAEHLARVAALDRAVCQVLHPLLRPGCVLSQSPTLYGALCALRQDEARHVRMARDVARNLGLSASRQQLLDRSIRERLQHLLEPVRPALERLAANTTSHALKECMT